MRSHFLPLVVGMSGLQEDNVHNVHCTFGLPVLSVGFSCGEVVYLVGSLQPVPTSSGACTLCTVLFRCKVRLCVIHRVTHGDNKLGHEANRYEGIWVYTRRRINVFTRVGTFCLVPCT